MKEVSFNKNKINKKTCIRFLFVFYVSISESRPSRLVCVKQDVYINNWTDHSTRIILMCFVDQYSNPSIRVRFCFHLPNLRDVFVLLFPEINLKRQHCHF